ncbi:MAG TPA: MaoC/PaaZ C-terminal domain-containing protein [Myxococcales bacterium]
MAKQFRSGDTFTHVRECDTYRPIYYAAASGDFNPIHLDKAVGEMAGLGGVVLHGMCTMAWAVEAAIKYLGDPGKLRKVRVRFSRPVAPDDTITFQGKVTSIENGHLVAEILAKNQRGEEVLKGATIEADVG